MKNLPPIEPGRHYHIYNRANGSENLFRGEADYHWFFVLVQRYILPVADLWAYVLMPNHFHFLVRIKENMVYKYSKEDFSSSPSANAGRSPSHKPALMQPGLGTDADAVGLGANAVEFDDVKWETIPKNQSDSKGPDGIGAKRKKANPTNHFSHLCNAYAKYINAKYNRHGSLFQRPFRRKPIENDYYLRQVILYIHNNPVHHRFVSRPEDYLWSSYLAYLSEKPTKLKRKQVLGYFDHRANFEFAHRDYAGGKAMGAWLEEDSL